MSTYKYNCSAVVPLSHADDARRMLWALGHDSERLSSFSIALSADRTPPASAYGLHTVVDQDFVDLFEAARNGNLVAQPQSGVEWSDFDLTPDLVYEAINSMTVVIVPREDLNDTWPVALDRAGVQIVEEPLPE